jgi:hypothetical protein
LHASHNIFGIRKYHPLLKGFIGVPTERALASPPVSFTEVAPYYVVPVCLLLLFASIFPASVGVFIVAWFFAVDTFPLSLLWRMLCHRCCPMLCSGYFAAIALLRRILCRRYCLGRCFAATVTMVCLRIPAPSGGCFVTLVVSGACFAAVLPDVCCLLLVDTLSPWLHLCWQLGIGVLFLLQVQSVRSEAEGPLPSLLAFSCSSCCRVGSAVIPVSLLVPAFTVIVSSFLGNPRIT